MPAETWKTGTGTVIRVNNILNLAKLDTVHYHLLRCFSVLANSYNSPYLLSTATSFLPIDVYSLFLGIILLVYLL